MNTVPLGEVIVPARVIRAGHQDFPVLSMTMHDGLVPQADRFKKRIASASTQDYKVVQRGQLVVGFPIDEGVLDVQDLYDQAIVSPAYGVWNLTSSDLVDSRYLIKFLRSPKALTYYKAKLQGSTARRRSLPASVFLELPVFLPPLSEQRRIAAILDKADAIRTKRRQVLAHLELAPFAAIESLLRDGVWDSRPLADLAEVWDCAHSTPVWTDSGKTCLRTSNLGRGFWDWTDTRYVSLDDFQTRQKGGGALPGDIILSREGTVGIGAMVQPGMTVAMGQRLVQVRAKSIDEHFLLWYLLYALDPIRISHVMVGATSKHLNVKDLRAMSIPTPGPDVQKQFANFATRLISEQEMVLQGIAQDDALFASLQSRAFKGEL